MRAGRAALMAASRSLSTASACRISFRLASDTSRIRCTTFLHQDDERDKNPIILTTCSSQGFFRSSHRPQGWTIACGFATTEQACRWSELALRARSNQQVTGILAGLMQVP